MLERVEVVLKGEVVLAEAEFVRVVRGVVNVVGGRGAYILMRERPFKGMARATSVPPPSTIYRRGLSPQLGYFRPHLRSIHTA